MAFSEVKIQRCIFLLQDEARVNLYAALENVRSEMNIKVSAVLTEDVGAGFITLCLKLSRGVRGGVVFMVGNK